MFRKILVFLLLSMSAMAAYSQEVITVQTFTFDSTGRQYDFTFPDNPPGSYEKIIMQYRMRCKDGLVSTGSDRNKGCGEWDYSNNTFITEPSLLDSVKRVHPSHIISGFSGTTFKYTSQPTYDIVRRTLTNTSFGSVISESGFALGTATAQLNQIQQKFPANRIFILYTQQELANAGFTAGILSGLEFTAASASGTLRNMKVSVKETGLQGLNSLLPDTTGMKVLFYNHYSPVAGNNAVRFMDDFNWSGALGILVEISFDLSSDGSLQLMGDDTNNRMASYASSGGNIDLAGLGYLNLRDADFSTINGSITFSCWVNGDKNFIPAQNTTLFEGVNELNQRSVNVHLPWSDKNAYWDCGSVNGSYDRVNIQVPPADYAGNWRHWVFTKDAATQKMIIFRSGNSFIQGSNKLNPVVITDLNFGRAFLDNIFFYGLADNFQMWDTAVNATMATGIMDGNETVLAGLQSHQKFHVRASRDGFTDVSGNNVEVVRKGYVGVNPVAGNKLYRNFTTMPRPKVTLLRTTYSSRNNSPTTSDDTIYHNPKTVLTYSIIGNKPVVTDSSAAYTAFQGKVTDEQGNILDAVPFSLNNTVTITQLAYYETYPQRLELVSFVTPYGIGLDLGMEGKMWEFDVSDFEPVLRGTKTLSMDFGGQYQEEMDIRFLFVKGTPPRVPRTIQQIWRVEQRGYTEINNGTAFESRSVPVPAGTASAKIRSVISGHGQEGEFIARNHKLDINNGQKVYSWSVWKSCGDNPVFPQGGTWTFDRAGWCPGMATDLKEYDITPYITPGGTFQARYTVTSPTGDSRYIANHQLVTYGPASFVRDAEISGIRKPSANVEFGKINPSCSSPEVVLRNTGSSPITSATIEYWATPGIKETFQWAGNLSFLQEITITLPVSSAAFWGTITPGTFSAVVTAVNGSPDEYSQNNLESSEYKLPPYHGTKILLNYKTNLYPQENSYTVKDINGNIIKSKSGFAANRTYYDTLDLSEGCYKLEFTDTGNDGLYYWYWDAVGQSHGTGSFTVKDLVTGVSKTFQPEFGSRLVYEFSVVNNVGFDDISANTEVNIYPNPTAGRQVNVFLGTGYNETELRLLDGFGREMRTPALTRLTDNSVELSLTDLPGGVYYLKINKGGEVIIRKIILL